MREAAQVAREFAESNRDAAASVRELQKALDDLGAMTGVRIHVTLTHSAEAPAADGAAP
jgi:hypothetical protein